MKPKSIWILKTLILTVSKLQTVVNKVENRFLKNHRRTICKRIKMRLPKDLRILYLIRIGTSIQLNQHVLLFQGNSSILINHIRRNTFQKVNHIALLRFRITTTLITNNISPYSKPFVFSIRFVHSSIGHILKQVADLFVNGPFAPFKSSCRRR